jgi:hypothetical protein
MQELIKKIHRFFCKSQNASTTKEPNYIEVALSHPKTPTKETLIKLIELEQREVDLVTQIKVFKEHLQSTSRTLLVRDFLMSSTGLFVGEQENKQIAKLAIQSAERDLAEVRKQISEINYKLL